jgi:hypothetical protein
MLTSAIRTVLAVLRIDYIRVAYQDVFTTKLIDSVSSSRNFDILLYQSIAMPKVEKKKVNQTMLNFKSVDKAEALSRAAKAPPPDPSLIMFSKVFGPLIEVPEGDPKAYLIILMIKMSVRRKI